MVEKFEIIKKEVTINFAFHGKQNETKEIFFVENLFLLFGFREQKCLCETIVFISKYLYKGGFDWKLKFFF